MFIGVNQRIQRVKELLLGSWFIRNELDVVNQQQIKRVIILLEFIELFCLKSPHDIGNVIRCMNIANIGLTVLFFELVSNGLD